jgi:hypothetical protein
MNSGVMPILTRNIGSVLRRRGLEMKGMEKGGEGVSYVMCTYCREKKRSRTPASSHHLRVHH